MIVPLLSGFLAGSVHVLTGMDHLSAVAPLTIKRPKEPWIPGMYWGVGHAGGVLIAGLLALLLRGVLHLRLLSDWSEILIGVTLVVIGLWGWRSAFKPQVHAHEHVHDGTAHLHVHSHEREDSPEIHSHKHAPLAVGTLHGLSGSSHLLSLLPALALPSVFSVCSYLLAFSLATVAAMASFSTAVGWLTKRFTHEGLKSYRTLLCACSSATFLVGLYWIFSSH